MFAHRTRRLLAAVWLAWLASVVWNWLVFRLSILHPPWQPLGLLFAIQIIAAVWLAIRCGRQIWRGGERREAVGSILLGTAPLWSWGALTSYVLATTGDGYIPFNVLIAEGGGMGASFGDLEARLRYPDRCEGRHVVMFHRDCPAAAEQTAAMDRHLDRMLALLGRPARGKAHWIRGSLWGRSGYYFQGLSMSDPSESQAELQPDDLDGLANVDRHELAHFAIEQLCDHSHRPPYLLVEGWAESQSGYPAGELARRAMRDRECGAELSLAELTGDAWYCRDQGPVYTQGGPLVDYLLRTYGGPKFFELYTTCRPQTFAEDVKRVLGVDLDQLDRDYWADIERRCPPFEIRLRGALEQLPLDEQVDAEAYREFAREFSAACAAREPPQDGVCEVTLTDEIDEGETTPRRVEQRVLIIRDGPRLGVFNHWDSFDEAIATGPQGSFRLRREQGAESWREFGSTFAPLARLHHLATIDQCGRHWQGQSAIAFDVSEIVELKRAGWRVTGLERIVRDERPLVELTLKREPPEPGRVNVQTYRFLPEQGWLFDGHESFPPSNAPEAMRTVSQMLYEVLPGAPPRRIGADFERFDASSGKRLSRTEHRIARRPLDAEAQLRFQRSSYPLEPPSIFSALPVPASVAITWSGAALSLVLGVALRAWARFSPRRISAGSTLS